MTTFRTLLYTNRRQTFFTALSGCGRANGNLTAASFKHFAHKLSVEFMPIQGKIPFSAGTCWLEAIDRSLTLKVEAEDASRLAQVQDVVEKHLLRFAFREPVKIEWTDADSIN